MKPTNAWFAFLVALALGVLLGARLGALFGLLLAAVFTDVMCRKIPNKLIVTGLLLGVSFQIFYFGLGGFISALGGFSLGFSLFLPFYFLRIMAAGDVKLMAMVGCFVGMSDIVGVVLGTLLAGGFLSLLFSLKSKSVRQLLLNVRIVSMLGISKVMSGKAPVNDGIVGSVGTLPYAMAIAVGTAGYFLWNGV